MAAGKRHHRWPGSSKPRSRSAASLRGSCAGLGLPSLEGALPSVGAAAVVIHVVAAAAVVMLLHSV